MLSSSTEDRQNRCRKVFRFCGCQSGWAPKLNLVVAEIKFVYTHLFNVYMDDMAYFNPGYKVNACFTVRLMIHNHLQNYQEGRVSKTLSCILRYKYIHLGRVGLDGNSQGRREFASQGLPRFTSALYHAAQTIALEPWWIISITSNFSPCLRSNRILKLPCATSESWWICGGGTLFRCFFRLRRKTAIQTPKGARTYTHIGRKCSRHP